MPMTPRNAPTVTFVLAWVVLGGALMQLPVVGVAVRLLPLLPAQGIGLLCVTLPGVVLALAGSILLLGQRLAGYHLLYLAFAVSLWTMRVPFAPIPPRWLPPGAMAGLMLRGLDAMVVVVLAWAHWTRVSTFAAEQARRQRTLLMATFGTALALFAVWRFQTDVREGPVATMEQLPVVGQSLAGLKCSDALQFRSVETRVPPGLTMVFSGRAARTNLEAFAQSLGLVRFKAEQRAKFLGLLRQWRLEPEQFPAEFGANDLFYSGRLPDRRKMLLQLCYRTSDGRFTGQILGVAAPTDGGPEGRPPGRP